MRYPSFLFKGATIGVVAPSFGVNSFPYDERYKSAKKKFLALGYKIKECPSLYNLVEVASNTAQIRAKEFTEMYLDEEVDFLVSAGGGEVMMEILPYLDFELLRNGKPKYIMGYSDNTNLTFLMNILLDTASMYGLCFPSFGMKEWGKSIDDALKIMEGKQLIQQSYEKYVSKDEPCEIGHALDSYLCDTDVKIQSLDGKDCHFEGRLIGGCLDVLDLLIGTPFDKVKEFNEKYQQDGIILFIESCELSVMSQYRSYWKLKQCGWLKNVKGIIIGRAMCPQECYGYDEMKIIEKAFKELNIPVLYGLDIGHVPPIWTIISGSYAKIEKVCDKCTIEYILK